MVGFELKPRDGVNQHSCPRILPALLRRSFAGLVQAPLALAFLVSLPVGMAAQETDSASPSAIRVGVIGLDTSHSIAFTKAMNAPDALSPLDRCQVVSAYPWGSRDIESSTSRIPGYTEEMQALGVRVVDSLDELIEGVDAVMLETNDGRPHLEQALQVLKRGKPLFVDKPMAASLADVIAIFAASKRYQTPVFSSSALRFSAPALAARSGNAVGKVLGADTFSPATLEPTHPDLYWYGIHGVEQLFTVMGTGCQSVSRSHTDTMDIVVGRWSGDRLGTFRGMRTGPHRYGGTVFGSEGEASSGGYEGYGPLVREIASFFVERTPPVNEEETIEIYAFMSAADLSRQRGGQEVELEEVLQAARTKARIRLQQLGVEPIE